MRELRLVEIFGEDNVSVYSEDETNKELRRMLNKAWDESRKHSWLTWQIIIQQLTVQNKLLATGT